MKYRIKIIWIGFCRRLYNVLTFSFRRWLLEQSDPPQDRYAIPDTDRYAVPDEKDRYART